MCQYMSVWDLGDKKERKASREIEVFQASLSLLDFEWSVDEVGQNNLPWEFNPLSWSTQEEMKGTGTTGLVEQPTTSACLTILTTSSMTLI